MGPANSQSTVRKWTGIRAADPPLFFAAFTKDTIKLFNQEKILEIVIYSSRKFEFE